MRRTLLSLLGAISLSAGAVGALADEHGKDLTMGDLPPAVQDSIRKEAKSNRVEEIKKTTDSKGNEVYKAEVVSGKKGTDLTLSPDGKILDRSTHSEAGEHEKGGY